MAARFWVTGGDGNWNSTTNWAATSGGASGESVPGSADTAALDANSGAGTVTLDISPDIQTLTCTDFTGTLAFGTNTISLNSTGTIFTGATTMTVTGTPQIIATNSSATARTISPQVVTEANSISFRVTAGTGSFTITSTHAVLSLDFTDGVNPTGFAGALASTSPVIYGSLKFSTGMSVTAGTTTVRFRATSGTKTIDTAGITFDRNITFDGIGGTWQLQSTFTTGAAKTTTLTNGTLDLNNLTLSTGFFSSSNSNVRSITWGTGNITLTGINGTIWTTATNTNLTFTGTPIVNCTATGAMTSRTIAPGALGEVRAINFNISAGTGIFALSGGGASYRSLDFTGFQGSLTVSSNSVVFGNLIISPTMTVNATTTGLLFNATSGTKQITTAGNTFDFPITFNGIGGTFAFQDALTQGSTRTFTVTNGTVQLKDGVTSTVGSFVATSSTVKFLQSTTPGSQATLSQASGTVNVVDLTIRDINAVGGASWNAYTDFENTDAGNNDGWNFSLSPPYSTAELPVTLRPFTQPRRF
jgi:hypothetical protein